MKKLFALAILFSVGCGMMPEPTRTPKFVQPIAGATVAVGSGDSIEWNCAQSEATDRLMGLECKFHNKSETNGEKEICLRISYFTGVSQELVAKSRLACSGPLVKNGVSNTFVYFQRQPRKELLAICGMDASFCRLSVVEENK